MKWVFDNPWIILVFGALAFVLLLDHWLKEKRRGQIGRELNQYKRKEHRQAMPVFYPQNLRGKKGRVRAAAQNSAIDSFVQWRTWPFWLTLTLLTFAGLAIVVLLALSRS